MNIEQARKAARNAAIAAFISAALTFLVVLIAVLSSSDDGTFGAFNDPANFIDVFIILACGIGLWRNSRAAGVVIVIYWILSKTALFLETGQSTGLATGLVFLYFFVRGTIGTFTFHRIRKTEDPAYRPAARWVYFVGIPAVVLITAALILGLLTMTPMMPSTEVQAGSDMTVDERLLLEAREVLLEDEEVDYFYSWGFSSVIEGGSLLSDQGITAWQETEYGEVEVFWLSFNDIKSIELLEQGDWLTDSVYLISGFDDDSWFEISLSVENDGDQLFIDAARLRLGKKLTWQQQTDDTPFLVVGQNPTFAFPC